MTALTPGSMIGIVGGGQLGRMLAMAAARLGYRTAVLDPQADCPAAQVANLQIVAAYCDPVGLSQLAAACQVVTYEFENVPVTAARTLAESVPVYPPPKALEVSQDRLEEKRFLASIGIPVARFAAINSADELADALLTLRGNGVLKTRRMGYDGKGQHVFRNATIGEAKAVFEKLGAAPLILEEFVPFKHELSVIAARGIDGTVVCYDPAENVHIDGILSTSTVPGKVSQNDSAAAKEFAGALLQQLGYVGIVGLEFFVGPDGELLANEFAPRVHNSGHWTEAACAVSQFEQHIRAIAGLPLGNPNRHSDCVMENLIGDEVERASSLLVEPDLMLHLYGKTETRPGRKMGHFTRLTPRMG